MAFLLNNNRRKADDAYRARSAHPDKVGIACSLIDLSLH
jgi:hypothetical protein